MCAAKGVDHERCEVVLKTECVMDTKIRRSQRKIVKTVITLEKTHVFHHENVTYQKKLPHLNDCSIGH